jgi:hypothetical protein
MMSPQKLRSLLVGILLLSGCTPSAPAPVARASKKIDAETEIREAFAALQGAVKERSGAKVYELLATDSRQDADRIAGAVKDMFTKADEKKRAELAKKVGLPEAKLRDLTATIFLESDLFHHYDEHDEIPDVKGLDRVDVKGDTAKLEYKDPDQPTNTSRLRAVREDGHWRFQLAMPKTPE